MHLSDTVNKKQMRKAQGNSGMMMAGVISSATAPQLLGYD